MKEIDLATQTMFAELLQRTLDAEFDAEFPEKGSFKRKKSKDRFYWHYQWRAGEKNLHKYVGPGRGPHHTPPIERFDALKSTFTRPQTPVRAPIAAGPPTPDPLPGAAVVAPRQPGL